MCKLYRYALVGIIGTISHISVLVLLVEDFYVDPVISSCVGFLVALMFSHILNHYWTFQSKLSFFFTFPRYVMVSLIGLTLNTTIMHITVKMLNWWYVSGQILVILIVPITNFILNQYWSFKLKNSQ